MTTKNSKPEILDARWADWNHQVVTIKSGRKHACKVPCKDCPWRRDAVGVFPAEAFRLSAATAYDMSDRTFGCHREREANYLRGLPPQGGRSQSLGSVKSHQW